LHLEVGKVGDIVGRAHGVELEEGATLARHGRHLHRALDVQLSLRVRLQRDTLRRAFGSGSVFAELLDPDPVDPRVQIGFNFEKLGPLEKSLKSSFFSFLMI